MPIWKGTLPAPRSILLSVLCLFLAPRFVAAQPVIATLTSPIYAATKISPPCTFEWTSAPNAQAYYLYVGTTPGANDAVNSGAIQTTSYTANSLPWGKTLYATIYTELAGVWYHTASYFTTVPEIALLTNPANESSNVLMPESFQWTEVPNAQAYYLYVGTTPGAKDIVNTGAIQASSFTAANLPWSETLYATIYTELGGLWYHSASSFTTMQQIALLTSPTNGAVKIPTQYTFQWTAVPNAQAYYLYVGTTPGAKDIVNTGAIQATSFAASNLPWNQTLYATIYTELNGLWYHSAASFTTTPEIATLTAPANGATRVPIATTFQWTSVPSAQAYYLYVGTTPGAKDVVNTGAIQGTSYTATNLPWGEELYVTIYTELNGLWYPSTSSLTTAQDLATLTNPSNGAIKVSVPYTFQWTSVASAQAYYLYVGTNPGANDVVNTGAIQGTSYTAQSLAWGQTLYATLFTEIGGLWYPSASTFTTVPQIALLTAPTNSATAVPVAETFEWTTAPNAQAYYLYVGTTPGAKDVVNTGAIQATSYNTSALPWGQTLYATMYTELNGLWYHSATTFTTARLISTLTTPANGAVGVYPYTPFQWTAVPNAEAYFLYVGTTPGAHDLVYTGAIQGLSFSSAGTLPLGKTLYATLYTEFNGLWYPSTSSFTTLQTPSATSNDSISAMTFPLTGSINIDAGQPFQWTTSNNGVAYWLSIGTTPGAYDVADSGPISVPRYFATGIPLGVTLYGDLYVETADGSWHLAQAFTFSAASNTITTSAMIQSAFWAVDYVRQMATDKNVVLPGTLLADVTYPSTQAVCSDFAVTLDLVLEDMNVTLAFRTLNIAFNPNHYDAHTLVEMYDPDQGSWMLLDPTFDLTATRSSDGLWASAEDINNATLNFAWSNITYVFLGAQGNYFAKAYYIDYPLLYLNIYHQGTTWTLGVGPSVLPYYRELPVPTYGYGFYAIRCTNQTTVIVEDATDMDTLYTVECDGVDSFSYIFEAESIVEPSGGVAFQLYTPNRYVF